MPYQKLKILYFGNGNLVIYMGNISKNLDQAMSKKKSSRRRGKTQRKNTQFFGPNWAKFLHLEGIFDKILPESIKISSSDSEQNLLIWVEFL